MRSDSGSGRDPAGIAPAARWSVARARHGQPAA